MFAKTKLTDLNRSRPAALPGNLRLLGFVVLLLVLLSSLWLGIAGIGSVSAAPAAPASASSPTSAPANDTCDPLIVTLATDDPSICGTLRYARDYIEANLATIPPADRVISLTLPAAPANRIELTATLTLPLQATLQTSCGSSVLLDGSNAPPGDGLVLAGGNTLHGVVVGGFTGRQIVADASGSGAASPLANKLECSRTKGGGRYDFRLLGGYATSAVVGTSFSPGFVARLTRWYDDAPIAGRSISFSVAGSGSASGSFSGQSFVNVQTDGNGDAAAPVLSANSAPGTFELEVTADGVVGTIRVGLTNLVGPPSQISQVSGGNQTAQVLTAFPTPFKVQVTDSFNNPLAGVGVIFNAPTSGASGGFGSANGAKSVTVSTDASGMATAPGFVANSLPGSYTVSANLTNNSLAPVSFNLTNVPGPPAIVEVVAGSNQSVNIGTAFPTPLQARVKDAGGNLLPGVNVTFTAPGASGANPTGTFTGGGNTATVTTDGSGIATAPNFTANMYAGSYNVVASAGSGSAVFALSNFYGPTTIQAYVSNANPSQNTNVTVYGKLIVNGLPAVGALMDTTWNYKTTTSYCYDDASNSEGIASCTKSVGRSTLGYFVRIDVVMTYNGQLYTTSTGFTATSP